MPEITLNVTLTVEDIAKYPCFVNNLGDVHINIFTSNEVQDMPAVIKEGREANASLRQQLESTKLELSRLQNHTETIRNYAPSLAGALALECMPKVGNNIMQSPTIHILIQKCKDKVINPCANKINMIKLVRHLTECGLKEAKDFCDENLFPLGTAVPPAQYPTPRY